MFIPVKWRKDSWENSHQHRWAIQDLPAEVSKPKQLFRKVIGVFRGPPRQGKQSDGRNFKEDVRPGSEDVASPRPRLPPRRISSEFGGQVTQELRARGSRTVVRRSRDFKAAAATSIGLEPLISLPMIELASNAKIYLETHFDRLCGEPTPRSLRRRAMERIVAETGMGESDARRFREDWRRRESEYLRNCRCMKMRIADFDIVKVIGKGAFGCVKLARMALPEGGGRGFEEAKAGGVGPGRVYALKVILKALQLKNGQEAHLRAERDFLVASEGSRWVVPLVASFQDKENLYLVMEYMIGGDFLGLLIDKGSLSEAVTRFYIAEMVLCIEEAHKLSYIHRDVKPDNFCITASGHLKICDFGLAFSGHWAHDGAYFEQQRWGLVKKSHVKVDGDTIDRRVGNAITRALSGVGGLSVPQGERILSWRKKKGQRRMARSIVGTYQYMAPEIVREHVYDARCDWWSLGVIIYECLFGHTPFHGESRSESKLKVLNWKEYVALEKEPSLSPEIQDIIRSLLCEKEDRLGSAKYHTSGGADQSRNYVYRGDAEEIKAHPFFSPIVWDTLHLQVPPFVPQGLVGEMDTRYFTESSTSDKSCSSYSETTMAADVRAKDLLLRDRAWGEEILELRKRNAFLGYTYTRPANFRQRPQLVQLLGGCSTEQN